MIVSSSNVNTKNPRTNPWNFWKKNLRTGGFENLSFFESAILNFFFQKKNIFASFSWKQVKVSWLARLGQNFDDYPGFQLFFTLGKHYAPSVPNSFLTSFFLRSFEPSFLSIYFSWAFIWRSTTFQFWCICYLKTSGRILS